MMMKMKPSKQPVLVPPLLLLLVVVLCASSVLVNVCVAAPASDKQINELFKMGRGYYGYPYLIRLVEQQAQQAPSIPGIDEAGNVTQYQGVFFPHDHPARQTTGEDHKEYLQSLVDDYNRRLPTPTLDSPRGTHGTRLGADGEDLSFLFMLLHRFKRKDTQNKKDVHNISLWARCILDNQTPLHSGRTTGQMLALVIARAGAQDMFPELAKIPLAQVDCEPAAAAAIAAAADAAKAARAAEEAAAEAKKAAKAAAASARASGSSSRDKGSRRKSSK